MKICIDCGEAKEMHEFHINTKHRDGKQNKCMECTAIYNKSYYKKNKNKEFIRVTTRNHIYRKFNMTDSLVKAEKLKRNYTCDICMRKFIEKKLVPDHCHKSMKYRGILCYQCNNGLGWYEKNRNKVSEYLK